MTAIRNERGLIKGLLILAVLGFIAYVGIVFGQPYYRYNTFRSHTKNILHSEITVLDVIKEKILAEAKELNIPLDENKLEVTQDNRIIKVKATWFETVDFWGYYQDKLDFVMEVEY